MSLTPQEQLKNFLEKSKEVLILLPQNPDVDAIGSAWALYWFLEKRNISPTIAFSEEPENRFNFLPRPNRILREISGARDFVLSFDTTRNKIINLRQEEKDGQFNIFLTPEKGSIDPRDFSFILARFKYDLVIVVGSSDLEKLGDLYFKNADLFFEVPVANIDHKSENDNFGQINLVDVTASSSSEIVAEFLENLHSEIIDKNIATCLLAGLIGATDSFQKKNTTPRALAMAANLMAKEADQQEIIRWMYKTQPLHVLKLWGRAMAKINWEENSRLVWSTLSVEDFVQSRASQKDLPLILKKLEESYSEGKIFMLLYNDTPDTGVALVRTAKDLNEKIHQTLGGNLKSDFLEIKIEKSNLTEAGREIVEKTKNILG